METHDFLTARFEDIVASNGQYENDEDAPESPAADSDSAIRSIRKKRPTKEHVNSPSRRKTNHRLIFSALLDSVSRNGRSER